MIDQERLDQLAEDFGQEDLAELVEVFLEETWQALDELGNMLPEPPAEAYRDQLHFLKGCARNLGASAFADRCEAMECEDGPMKESDYLMLRASLQAVSDFFSGSGVRASAS